MATIATPRTGQELYEHAKTLIPGGTQLLSKRPEMFLPGQWPAYYVKAKGIECWDPTGRKYIDFATNGIGAPVLGFADPDVDAAVMAAIQNGSMCTLNSPEEVELAELLIELHPWAEMARFARGGGEAMAIAVRIARASTGRDTVLFCGYHGWQDWYLAANIAEEKALDGHLLRGLEPAGVPRGLRGSVVPFPYNDLATLERLIAEAPNGVAAIVMEPTRMAGPLEGYLEGVRAAATRAGAVLIFDEVTSGFRMNTGGIHRQFGVDPDIATFAKALGNGYPISAIIGRRSVMESAQKSFISSTMWTERLGPTAALATIRKHRDRNVPASLNATGTAVQLGWRDAAAAHGLEIDIYGIPPLSHIGFKGEHGLGLATLFIQGMLDRGYLTSLAFYPSYAHQPSDVERYLVAVHEVFGELAAAVREGTVAERLRGPLKHSGFQRLA